MLLIIFLLLVALPIWSIITLYADSLPNKTFEWIWTLITLLIGVVGILGVLYLAYKGCGA